MDIIEVIEYVDVLNDRYHETQSDEFNFVVTTDGVWFGIDFAGFELFTSEDIPDDFEGDQKNLMIITIKENLNNMKKYANNALDIL